MKRQSLCISVATLSLSLGGPHPARAYDISTHALLTSDAVKSSSIGHYAATPLLSSLGLVDYDEALGKRYFDLGSARVTRTAHRFEKDIIDSVRIAQISHQVPGELSVPRTT
jgi:hypothetical protein